MISDSQTKFFKVGARLLGGSGLGAVAGERSHSHPQIKPAGELAAQAEQRGGGPAAPALFVGQQRQAGVAGQARRLGQGLSRRHGKGAEQATQVQLLFRLCREGRRQVCNMGSASQAGGRRHGRARQLPQAPGRAAASQPMHLALEARPT